MLANMNNCINFVPSLYLSKDETHFAPHDGDGTTATSGHGPNGRNGLDGNTRTSRDSGAGAHAARREIRSGIYPRQENQEDGHRRHQSAAADADCAARCGAWLDDGEDCCRQGCGHVYRLRAGQRAGPRRAAPGGCAARGGAGLSRRSAFSEPATCGQLHHAAL